MAERGLDREWDLGAVDYRARYYGERPRAMVGHEFHRVALARVRGRLEGPVAGGGSPGNSL